MHISQLMQVQSLTLMEQSEKITDDTNFKNTGTTFVSLNLKSFFFLSEM